MKYMKEVRIWSVDVGADERIHYVIDDREATLKEGSVYGKLKM